MPTKVSKASVCFTERRKAMREGKNEVDIITLLVCVG
jgi:hypothetical protein